MADSKSLDDLSPFFSKSEANAIIVTDCKLDDALCLWYFFLLNFSRPAGHKVNIKVFVIGIQDLPGAEAMVRHIYQEAKAHATKTRRNSLSVNVQFSTFISKSPGPEEACRHEQSCYAPYHDVKSGFPQAKKAGDLKFFQDLDASTCGGEADFVGILCQFFWHGVLNESTPGQRGPGFNADVFDYIVPKAGGMLAFQMGFNTRLSGNQQEQEAFWGSLRNKMRAAGSKMVFISNVFSFAKGAKKSGTVDPEVEPFVPTLKKQAPKLWDHLFKAGALDSCAFSCDQMAKWVVGFEPRGMEAPAKLAGQISKCRDTLQLSDSKDRNEISAMLKAVIVKGDEGVAKVLAACSDLYSSASETCGSEKADYLNRAKVGLEKFGRSLEITDGQHFVALFQSRVPVLQPVTAMSWVEAHECLGPVFGTDNHDGIMWAAKDIDVAQCLGWMEQMLKIPAAHNLTLGRNSPVEMRVTAKKPPSFYITSAQNLLNGVEKENGQKLPAVNVLTISGLGDAVYVASCAAVAVEREGHGTIEKIETAYVDLGSGGKMRADPQIKITIRRRA